MRILLAIGDQPIQRELASLLERNGHALTQLTQAESPLSALDQGARFHAAVLDQSALGRTWPRQIRQLRRWAPYLPAVVLLAPGDEQGWRHAILAGAFEAVPISSGPEIILETLSRAAEYSGGRPLLEIARMPAAG